MNRLRVPPLETRVWCNSKLVYLVFVCINIDTILQYSHWSSYGLGLFMGMSSVLIVCSIILGKYSVINEMLYMFVENCNYEDLHLN